MRRRYAWLMTVALLAPPASAFDVGDPWFYEPWEGPTQRIEFVYESLSRNLRLQYDAPMLGTPAGGPTMIGVAPPELGVSDEADVLFFRWVCVPTEMVSTQFDIGFTGGEGDEDSSLVLGGAARVLLTEGGPFQLAAQFDGHYIPGIEESGSGVSPINGPYQFVGEYRVHEFGVALLGSMTSQLSDGIRLMTYGGPRISTYQGRFESHADYSDTGERLWLNGETKQESVFGMVVGSRIDLGPHLSARIEGRLIEEQSLSGSLMVTW